MCLDWDLNHALAEYKPEASPLEPFTVFVLIVLPRFLRPSCYAVWRPMLLWTSHQRRSCLYTLRWRRYSWICTEPQWNITTIGCWGRLRRWGNSNISISLSYISSLLLSGKEWATFNVHMCCRIDRLCGLVVRVLGYRVGGPGSIPGTTRCSGGGGEGDNKEWVWNGVHSALWVQLRSYLIKK
jgi:hypothetical protein